MAPTFSPSITADILVHMDLVTLLAFRGTSRDSLQLVRKHLMRNILQLVGRFVPNPGLLLMKLGQHGAFISGSTALQFFLRHTDLQPRNLDIFLPVDSMSRLLAHILYDQGGVVVYPTYSRVVETQDLLAEQVITLSTLHGEVTLWQSETPTPFLPIACGPTSLHFVYLNPQYFGCAYPSLLFKQRGLLGRPDLSGFDNALAKCRARGLDFRFFTRMWNDSAHHGSCAGRYYACPAQQRTFSDGGSLRVRMSPLMDQCKTHGGVPLRPLFPRVYWTGLVLARRTPGGMVGVCKGLAPTRRPGSEYPGPYA